MRAVLLITATLLLSRSFSLAQDIIVTQSGDTLNCAITKVKSGFIYFTYRENDQFRSTLLPLSQVKFYREDYFQTAEVPKNKIIGAADYSKIRLGIGGGFSYMTGRISDKVPQDFEQYIKELKTGYHINTEFAFFIAEYIGFGAKYSLLKTKNKINSIYVTDMTGLTRFGMLKDDITIHFVGPSFVTRASFPDDKAHFLLGLAVGYIRYKNDAVVIDPFILTANTLGMSFDLGFDFRLANNLFMGFAFSYTLGTITQYEADDGVTKQTIKLEKGNYENISRLDLTAGFRFYK